MTQKSPFAGWCSPPSRLKSFLFAAAMPVSLSIFANQAAMAMPAGSCPAESAASTDTARQVCGEDDAGTEDGASLQSLDALSAHGLDPARYTGNGASARAAWLLAATHLRRGAIDAETLEPRLEADSALAETFDALPTDADAKAYGAALDALAPDSPFYTALKAELAAHQQSPLTSAQAEAASAAQARMASLRTSLERMRWLPRDNTAHQIYANIPTFEVVALTGDTEVSRHVAIFGEEDRQTPEFSDSITYLEFSPWWNVPASMARRDKLPDFQNDPGAIEELGYKVLNASGRPVDASNINWNSISADDFPYRLRQAPGPDNALGQVKIMFPNEHAIYLHDTPHTELFDQSDRALSAGCIRVEDIMALSEWILEDTPGWDKAKIDAVTGSTTETRATLAAPMSIHLVYLTAFPAADGSITYAPDTYGLDAALLSALAGNAPDEAAGTGSEVR